MVSTEILGARTELSTELRGGMNTLAYLEFILGRGYCVE